MKRIVFILITLVASAAAMAQSAEQLMLSGNEAYKSGDYQAAAAAYTQVLDAGFESAELYYNLGNAYYRQDEFGQAVLNYERSLRLSPNFRDARQNLALAQSRTEDQIESLPELFVVRWLKALLNLFSPRGWRVCLLVLALFAGVCVVLFRVGPSYALRKGGFVGACVLAVLLAAAIACAAASHHRLSSHRTAVVTAPMLVVKSSPEQGSVDKLVLHDGTEVTVEETLGDWLKVSIADGNSGWVRQSDVTII